MSEREKPSPTEIRLAAVRAAGERIGVNPRPTGDSEADGNEAASAVVAAARAIEQYIASGKTYW